MWRMAEQIPYGVAVSIINRLASLAFREIGLIYGVQSELEKLQETLESIKVVLSDAEEKRQDPAVEHWIKRLKEVLHDADDLLDDLATQELQRKVEGRRETVRKVSDFFSSSNKIVFRLKMAHKINKIWEKFNRVAGEMCKLNFNPGVIVIKQNEDDRRETSSFVLESEIVGREESKNDVINMLFQTKNHRNVSLVAIVGIGGLGKTALAQVVFNDGEVMKFFQKRMWVYVSENFEIKSLVKKILELSTNCKVDDQQLELLQSQLRESLNGQRFLLVLDDVWNESHEMWNHLKSYLTCGAQGSKILVTTRSGIVAETMDVDVSYVLKGLTEEQSWALFEKLAFRESARRMNLNLVSMGQKIAEKCAGVPLALRTMGTLLQFKREESEWLTILDSDFGKLCQEKNSVMPMLKLSYSHLPVELKQCFAYCSLYPKGWKIKKEQLIQLWMAQGYLQSTTESQNMDEIGNQYVKMLVMRSFFQDVEANEYGDIISFQMHDLMHDLAKLVAGRDCSLCTQGDKNAGRPMHVSFQLGAICLLDLLDENKLRTILRPSSYRIPVQSINKPSVFLRFRQLRVLDLSHSSIIELPESVGKLKHLRYFDLSYCYGLTNLPKSIGNLVNLQTLNLSRCHRLENLPKSFTNLISLKHLIYESCPAFDMMPAGLGKLTSLQYLTEFVVGKHPVKEIATLNELRELNNLGGILCIKKLNLVQDVASESKEVNLNRKRYLHSLWLYWGGYEDNINSNSLQLLDNLHPHENLKDVRVSMYPGVRFSNWLSSLTNVVTIHLSKFKSCLYLPPLEGLVSLKSLVIEYMDALKYICFESYEEISSTTASSPLVMPTRVFFPCLEKLLVNNCPKLLGWKCMHQRDLALPPFPRLSSLSISDCQNLTWMPTFPYLVEKLTLLDCNVTPLVNTLVNNMVRSTATQEDSVLTLESSFSTSLCRLESMKIGYIQIEALPEGWIRGLTSLKSLSIEGFPSLTSVFHNIGCLPVTLEHLEIRDVIDIWNYHEGASSSTMQHQVIHGSPTLQSISLIYCDELLTLPEWICNILSLQSISIENYEDFFYPTEGMRRLTNLQTLICPRMDDTDEVRSRIAHIPEVITSSNVPSPCVSWEGFGEEEREGEGILSELLEWFNELEGER